MVAAPYFDPALAIELSWEARKALMTYEDWCFVVDRFFVQEEHRMTHHHHMDYLIMPAHLEHEADWEAHEADTAVVFHDHDSDHDPAEIGPCRMRTCSLRRHDDG